MDTLPLRYPSIPGDLFDRLSFSRDATLPSVIQFEDPSLYSIQKLIIRAATIPRLVVYLTSPDTLDYGLLSDFFLTYRHFSNSTYLAELLLERLQWAIQLTTFPPDVDPLQCRSGVISLIPGGRFSPEIGRDVALRTFVVIRHWILNYFPDDFVVSYQLRSKLCQGINKLEQWDQIQKSPFRDHITRIFHQLKLCWLRSCCLYWNLGVASEDADKLFDLTLPIFPGGAFGDQSPIVQNYRQSISERRQSILKNYTSVVNSMPASAMPGSLVKGVLALPTNSTVQPRSLTPAKKVQFEQKVAEDNDSALIRVKDLLDEKTGNPLFRRNSSDLSAFVNPSHTPMVDVLTFKVIRDIEKKMNNDSSKGEEDHSLESSTTSSHDFEFLSTPTKGKILQHNSDDEVSSTCSSIPSTPTATGYRSKLGTTLKHLSEKTPEVPARHRPILSPTRRERRKHLEKSNCDGGESDSEFWTPQADASEPESRFFDAEESNDSPLPSKVLDYGLDITRTPQPKSRAALHKLSNSSVNSLSSAYRFDSVSDMQKNDRNSRYSIKSYDSYSSSQNTSHPDTDLKRTSDVMLRKVKEVSNLRQAAGFPQRSPNASVSTPQLGSTLDDKGDTCSIKSYDSYSSSLESVLPDMKPVMGENGLRKMGEYNNLRQAAGLVSSKSLSSNSDIVTSTPKKSDSDASSSPSVIAAMENNDRRFDELIVNRNQAEAFSTNTSSSSEFEGPFDDVQQYGGIDAEAAKALAAIPDESSTEDELERALRKLEGRKRYPAKSDDVAASITDDSIIKYPSMFRPSFLVDEVPLSASSGSGSSIASLSTGPMMGTSVSTQSNLKGLLESSAPSSPVKQNPTRVSDLGIPEPKWKRSTIEDAEPIDVSSEFDFMEDSPKRKAESAPTSSTPPKRVKTRSSSLRSKNTMASTFSIGEFPESHFPFILGYKAAFIAQQLTLVERDALAEVDWKELVDVSWSKDVKPTMSWLQFLTGDRSQGLEIVVSRFNLMVNWVKSEVLLTKNKSTRANAVTQFIRIAKAACRFQNYATMAQLTLALLSLKTILPNTWSSLSVIDLQDFAELEKIMSPVQNFTMLRNLMNSCEAKLGMIPFLGIFLNDIQSASRQPLFYDTNMVNVRRCTSLATAVKSFIQCVEWANNYDFEGDEEVLAKCVYLHSLASEEMDYCLGYLENP